jgi:hypothetical protein
MRVADAILTAPSPRAEEFAARRADAVQVGRALGWGLAITLAQVLLACCLSGEVDPGAAYLKLFESDGGYYASIVQTGYDATPSRLPGMIGAANVAFFPGYPALVGLLQAVFHFERIEYVLLLASQLGCWGFWTYLLLLFERWRVPSGLAVLGMLGIACHPAAFYLVATYSESTFLMALLGFVYWTGRPGHESRLMAAAHGFLMTATRLVGLPLVILPLLTEWLAPGLPVRDRLKRSVVPALIAAVAALGCFSYFAFCQWRFGHWDLYMKIEESGWQVRPDYLALFSPRIFHVHWPNLNEGFIDPEFVSRLSVPVTVVLFALLAWAEWRMAKNLPGTDWRQRVGFYLGAWLMFYICVSGHSNRGMSSMVRFSLCVQVLLVLTGVHLTRPAWPSIVLRNRVRMLALLVVAVVSFLVQIALACRFVHGQWVA